LINVEHYSQNHAQNWIFGPHYGVSVAIYALYLKISTQRNFVAEIHRENVSLVVKQRISVSVPLFSWGQGLGVTYAIHL